MRRLAFIAVLAAVAIPAAAVAADRSAGDGVLELRSVNGTVTLTGRGVLWGQIDNGSLRVTGTSTVGTQEPLVSGAERTRPVGEDVTVYWGNNLTFRVTGGKYRIHFRGYGLDLTAIGVGTADMTGDPLAFDTGRYALDGGKFVSLPLGEKLVAYGTLTPTATSPASGP